jgi:hypothetical protein
MQKAGETRPVPTPYRMHRTMVNFLYRNRPVFAPVGSNFRRLGVSLCKAVDETSPVRGEILSLSKGEP